MIEDQLHHLLMVLSWTPSIAIISFWVLARMFPTTPYQDPFVEPQKADLIWQAIYKLGDATWHEWPPSYRYDVWARRNAYYEALGAHLYPDCPMDDWRVVEVAIEHGIPAELALMDAREKRFL